MSDWAQWLGDWRIGVLCALVALLVTIRLLRRAGRWWRGRRPARLNPKLQAFGDPDERLVAERRKQAATILATSSTGSIPGYHLIEQIEAVYVDGFRRPDEAIEGLKALGRLVPPGDPDHVITAFNDCDTLTVETLDAGNLDAFGTHQSWDLCDVVVKLAFTHTILGQPVPGKIDVPMKVITRDNIDTEEGKVLGAPVYPRMPVGQWDLWPVLDTSLGVSPGLVGPDGNYVEIETPTKALRMELQGY